MEATRSEKDGSPVKLKLIMLHYVRLIINWIAHFFFTLYYGKEGERIPPIKDAILTEPATVVAKKIRNKELSSVQALEACIKRINDIKSALNCLVEDRFEQALKEAKDADELIRSGSMTPEQLEREKPFLGVPFTTKDCIAVQGLHQTAGVVLRKDFISDKDADAIRRLRENGAIIIGITNVPELCMWWETHNHIYGRTNNPYNTTRIVGGSSGGEACIQAAAGSFFGIGSDIGGSIRMPAYFNGIFGHKSSRKIVSNDGQYPEPSTELHKNFLSIGPMTKFAVDLKPIMKIISGDNRSKLNLDEPVDIAKLKFFYQFGNGAPLVDPVEPEIVQAMKAVVEYMYVKHKIVAEEKKIKRLRKSREIWFANMKDPVPFSSHIMKKNSTCAVLLEIIKNIVGLSGNTLIGLITALVSRAGVKIGDEKYLHYLKERDHLEKTFTDMLGTDGVFLYPTHPTAAPYHNEPLLKAMNFSYTSIINCLGLPATNVPLGLNKEGLPIGIQVIANYNNDRLCFAVAEELERGFGGWVKP